MTVVQPLVLLAAGGTGGHLFPAEALARVLRARGLRVALATDPRVGAFARDFPADEVVEIASATPSGGSLIAKAGAAVALSRGFLQATRVVRRLNPAVVVGFGGYPTVPPVAAASLLRVPTLIHEQNAVIGRANALLARMARRIATGFPEVRGIPPGSPAAVVHTGNPVRPAVIEAAGAPYPARSPEENLRVLVFGGSQGARVMAEVVPAAVEHLPEAQRRRLALVQQARPEDLAGVRAIYARLEVEAEVEPFYADLPRRMAESHLVVSRAGASTVAELAVIGRPSILVPLPGSLDQDQAANAASLGRTGAAVVLPQTEFTPERLASEIGRAIADPAGLTSAAAAAKSAGIPDAAERLADCVVATAQL